VAEPWVIAGHQSLKRFPLDVERIFLRATSSTLRGMAQPPKPPRTLRGKMELAAEALDLLMHRELDELAATGVSDDVLAARRAALVVQRQDILAKLWLKFETDDEV